MPVDHEDLLVTITEGLGDDYHTIIDIVSGRDILISIDKLHEKHLNQKNTLVLLPNNMIELPASANAAQFLHQPNHPYFRDNQSGCGRGRPLKPYLCNVRLVTLKFIVLGDVLN
ncbi:hypothetical protein V5N11_020715 [Cardamine amara subsp. amara]|uniref:Uncharacterized protein n=1 Tax=Cardamine amara subsp. amara TaxID=228776 RepID=A0ABD1BZ48_CARAN